MLFAFAIICQSGLTAQTVVVDDNLTFEPGQLGSVDENVVGTILLDIFDGSPTSVGFQYTEGQPFSTLEAISINADAGSDWYLAEAGDVVSATTIASGQF